MNIYFYIDHNDVPFFQYRDLFFQEYMLSCMLKSTFEPNGTLVLRGEKHLFLQIYTDFVPIWLKIIDWHSQVNMLHIRPRSLFIWP